MQENLLEAYFTQMLDGITPEEFSLVQHVSESAAQFSQEWFGRRMVPRPTVLQSLNVLRHVKYLFPHRAPRILEMGPGSGQLGALAIAQGFPYVGMDVTQAFYLLQNHLWHHMSGGRLRDGVLVADALEHVEELRSGHALHVPWWKFAQLTPSAVPTFDAVICNHAVCEMHDLALRFSLLLSKQFLKGKADEMKIFLFQGWGLSGADERAVATRRFYESGFTLVHHDFHIAVFAPAESLHAQGALPLPTEDGGYRPVEHVAKESAISQAILRGRETDGPRKDRNMRVLIELYQRIVGQQDLDTPDEKFWKLVGQSSRIGSQCP